MAARLVGKVKLGGRVSHRLQAWIGLALLILFAWTCRPGVAQVAPDIAGTWQGTLPEGRIVLKIKQAGDLGPKEGWKGVLYSLDADVAAGRSASSIALEGATLRFRVASIDGLYEGKLSSDRTSILGTWTRNKESNTLNLLRRGDETAWAMPQNKKMMPRDADPAFDVATIKPSKSDDSVDGYGPFGSHVTVENCTVNRLIQLAYGLHRKQVEGGQDWPDTDRYDIDGVADVAGNPNDKQMRAMFRKLLSDRFQLTFHSENKELSVYAITVEKGDPKLTKSLGDPNGFPDEAGNGGNTGLTVRYTNYSMADFAENLQTMQQNGKPVVDQTGLTGRYDFTLKWWPYATPSSNPDAAPELFTAIREQLGFRLEVVKDPMEVIVIDHVERPSAN